MCALFGWMQTGLPRPKMRSQPSCALAPTAHSTCVSIYIKVNFPPKSLLNILLITVFYI
jgi:hypothetical protein